MPAALSGAQGIHLGFGEGVHPDAFFVQKTYTGFGAHSLPLILVNEDGTARKRISNRGESA
jgi:hypothetical protein